VLTSKNVACSSISTAENFQNASSPVAPPPSLTSALCACAHHSASGAGVSYASCHQHAQSGIGRVHSPATLATANAACETRVQATVSLQASYTWFGGDGGVAGAGRRTHLVHIRRLRVPRLHLVVECHTDAVAVVWYNLSEVVSERGQRWRG
jgi:hypothetical protein